MGLFYASDMLRNTYFVKSRFFSKFFKHDFHNFGLRGIFEIWWKKDKKRREKWGCSKVAFDSSPTIILIRIKKIDLKLSLVIFQRWSSFEMFLFCSCVPHIYNPGQNIWKKVKKFSKTGQDYKNLISNFACFLTAIVKV